MNQRSFGKFWMEAVSIGGSITPYVVPHVLFFGVFSVVITIAAWYVERTFNVWIGLELGPHEIAGAALSLLLILRTNAGYDRWWEARKIWGGIVNQSRNLVISGLTYGPEDAYWRLRFVRWASAFPFTARTFLQREPLCQQLPWLVGPEASERAHESQHLPIYVATTLAELIREARERNELDDFAFLQVDRERALLIDYVGACERILNTPLPLVYAIKIRQFIVFFLLTLPFVLLHQISSFWLVPVITMLIAYPLIALDQIGVELQNPFAVENLSHLPLGDISRTIEGNLNGILKTASQPLRTNVDVPWSNEAQTNPPRSSA